MIFCIQNIIAFFRVVYVSGIFYSLEIFAIEKNNSKKNRLGRMVTNTTISVKCSLEYRPETWIVIPKLIFFNQLSLIVVCDKGSWNMCNFMVGCKSRDQYKKKNSTGMKIIEHIRHILSSFSSYYPSVECLSW